MEKKIREFERRLQEWTDKIPYSKLSASDTKGEAIRLAKEIFGGYKCPNSVREIVEKLRKPCTHTVSGEPERGHMCSFCTEWNSAIDKVMDLLK